MEGMNFAAIDIGTNAARLLIKNIDHNPLGENKFGKCCSSVIPCVWEWMCSRR